RPLHLGRTGDRMDARGSCLLVRRELPPHAAHLTGAVKTNVRNMIPWQLAVDPEAYGEIAGKWIITTADGEDEIGDAVYGTEQACNDALALLAAAQAVIDNWERGDLAAAVRQLAAALARAQRPV